MLSNRIINEGAPVGLYSILDAPRDAIDNGSFSIGSRYGTKGYLWVINIKRKIWH